MNLIKDISNKFIEILSLFIDTIFTGIKTFWNNEVSRKFIIAIMIPIAIIIIVLIIKNKMNKRKIR